MADPSISHSLRQMSRPNHQPLQGLERIRTGPRIIVALIRWWRWPHPAALQGSRHSDGGWGNRYPRISVQGLQSKDLPHFFRREAAPVVRRGDDSHLYLGAAVFTVSSASNISSPGLDGATSPCMKRLRSPRFMFLPVDGSRKQLSQREGGSILFLFLFKLICLTDLTSYIVCCDLGADWSSSCLQKPVPFLWKIIGTRPQCPLKRGEKLLLASQAEIPGTAQGSVDSTDIPVLQGKLRHASGLASDLQ